MTTHLNKSHACLIDNWSTYSKIKTAEDEVEKYLREILEEIERQMILRTLDKTGNNKTRAAELLEISLKTLHNKLNAYRAKGLLQEKTH